MWERTDEDQQSDGDLEEQSGTLQPWHLWRAKLHATLTQKGRRDDPGPSKTVNIFVLCFSSLSPFVLSFAWPLGIEGCNDFFVSALLG